MSKQIEGKGSAPAPSFVKTNSAPPFVKNYPGAKNTLDQAKGAAPDSGQTAGGSRQGGRKGSNSPTE